MTNAHRVWRGLDSDPSCKVCNYMEEDTSHILCDCPIAREVWSHLIPYNSINNFYTLPTRTWLVANLEPCLMKTKNWPLLFATSTWWLWKWQNYKCFEDPNCKPYKPWEFILTKVKEIDQALRVVDPLSLLVKRRINREIFIKWELPTEGWIKMNLDGASKGNPKQAGGGPEKPLR